MKTTNYILDILIDQIKDIDNSFSFFTFNILNQ